MGRVTNAVLMLQTDYEDRIIEHINKSLEASHGEQEFSLIPDELPGGSKVMTCALLAAGFNHIPEQEVADAVMLAPYGPYDTAVLTCINQEDEVSIWVLGNGQWQRR